jgi:uncharacterized protein (TIGR02001 family)
MFKKLLMPLFVATCFSPFTFADVSGKVGVMSDYMWRGQTQSMGDTSYNLGIDYNHDNGLYGSAWMGQVDFGDEAEWEYDLAVGYNLTVTDNLSLGGGVIQYSYNEGYDDIEELFVNASYKNSSIYYYVDSDNSDNTYMEFTQHLAFLSDVPGDFYVKYGDFNNGDDWAALKYSNMVAPNVQLSLHIMDGVRHGDATDSMVLAMHYLF